MQMEPLQRFGRSYKFNGVTLSGFKKIVGDAPFIFSAQEFSEQINFHMSAMWIWEDILSINQSPIAYDLKMLIPQHVHHLT